MPYKDPERKKEWERLHRVERLARRGQLRQIEAAERQPQPDAAKVEFGNSALLIPVIVGEHFRTTKEGATDGELRTSRMSSRFANLDR